MSEENGTKAANRRGARRRPPRTTVRVECRRGTFGMGPNLAAGFLDISESGVRIILKSPLDAGQACEVSLNGFSLHKPVKAIAKVAWVLPLEDGRFCVGLAFEKRLAFRDVQLLAAP
jgi:hypothetical protein